MLDLFNHELRLKADPSRVVVRAFHIGWQANGKASSRTERLVRSNSGAPSHSSRSRTCWLTAP